MELYIEEYSLDLQYIPGGNNVVADTLSRLDKDETTCEDSMENFYSIIEAPPTTKEKQDFSKHPVSLEKLE